MTISIASLIAWDNTSNKEHRRNKHEQQSSWSVSGDSKAPYIASETAKKITIPASTCILQCLRPIQQERNSMFRGMKSCSNEQRSQSGITLAGQKRKNAYSMSNALKEKKHNIIMIGRLASYLMYLPNNCNNAPTNMGRTLNIEQLVKFLVMFLFAKRHQHEVENTIEKDDNQDEGVTIVASLVDSNDKTESLHHQ